MRCPKCGGAFDKCIDGALCVDCKGVGHCTKCEMQAWVLAPDGDFYIPNSPIERLLLTALLRQCPADIVWEQTRQCYGNSYGYNIFCCAKSDDPPFLVPQYPVGRYRIDFAIIGDDRKIAIEADGHDFHERTKQQAEHDRRRDRDLQAAGWTVYRYTGSEIYRDADACAREIFARVWGLA